MKFWELISAFREFENTVGEILSAPTWRQPFGAWYAEKNELIRNQDRAKLDSKVPEALVLQVAAAIGDQLVFYLEGSWLRTRAISGNYQRLSALDVVTRFG